MSEHISSRADGAVLRLGFARPDKKNAITADMYAALADGIEASNNDSAIRAVLFESQGDMFTAGNDIADFLAGAPQLGAEGADMPPVMRFLWALAKAEKPLIAAVQGPAVGVGVTMLLHCDLVYAAPAATFHTPFVDLALVPEAASSLLLPQMIGHQRASAMLLAGEKISAEEAAAFGFVNRIVEPASLNETALGAARSLSEKAPEALRLTKALIKGDRNAVIARMKEEGAHFGAQLQSAEFREAGMAFMQKRKPDFSKLG